MKRWLNRHIWVLAAAVLAGSLSATGAQAQGIAGPYLAAKQAESRGDVAAAARLYVRALARDSNNIALTERAMQYQIAAGNVAEGIALARRLDARLPSHHLGTLALAADMLMQGDGAAAFAQLEDHEPFAGQIMSAWAAFDDGEIDTARMLLQELEASEDNGPSGQIMALYHRGLIEAAAGEDAAAVEALRAAAEKSQGGTVRLVQQLAGAQARLGKPDEALSTINDRVAGTYGSAQLSDLAARIEDGETPPVEIDSAAKGSAEVLFGISALISRGQSRTVALAYAQLAGHLDPTLTDATLLAAQILDRDEQFELAIATYEQIPPEAPEALNAQIGRAEAFQAMGKIDEAIAAMRATTSAFPDAVTAHTSLGDMLRRESMFEDAAAAYGRAVALLPRIEPHHWALFYQRGIARERSKQWEDAEADFHRALELRPDQPDVLNYLGYSWVEKGQNLSQAEEMIEKAVEKRPDDGYIVDSLGWVLYRFGEFDRALEQLERAVELRPVDPVINDHFGDALWMVGRQTEARFQWKRALSFEPDEEYVDRIRRKLDIGLDKVLAEEEAEGLPGIIGRNAGTEDQAEQQKNGG